MTNLSVNLNKVALLRNQRDLPYPNLIEMARIAIAAGCHGITVHPRPDERHIRRNDVVDIAEYIANEGYGEVEFNIEGYPSPDFIALVSEAKPDQVTLVPDTPEQRTSDHGWDIEENRNFLIEVISQLHESGVRVSLFIDPDPDVAYIAKNVGTDRVELYTEPYSSAYLIGKYDDILIRYADIAKEFNKIDIGVNAGHDLNLENLAVFLQNVPNVQEVSIGHALTADALKMGMANAIKAYLGIITASSVS